MSELNEIKNQTKTAVLELMEIAKPKKGDVFIVGCSSSEVIGKKLGTCSSVEVAEEICNTIYPLVKEKGLYLAAQCCEHLNRAVIVERELAEKQFLDIVNVVPQPKAGGSFATALYKKLENPVAVESISANLGIDIGCVLIGMQLKRVAVPVRLSIDKIGMAHIVCARTRPKYIGGCRAVYDEELL